MRNPDRIETDFGKPWDTVTIGDLREWHELYARCRLCDRRSRLDASRLERRYRPYAALVDVQTRLKCDKCENATGNEIEVERLPRNI